MTSQNVPPVNQQPGQKVWLRRLITGLLVTALPIWGILSTLVQPVSAGSIKKPRFSVDENNIVISEFRFTGNNGAADEFIEIFNPTGWDIPIGGWKIRGSNNAGTISDRYSFPVGTTLQPGQHYLITGSGFNDGIASDGSLSSGITPDGGVALTLANDSVIDAVGLSSLAASAFGPTSPLITTLIPSGVDQSYERKLGGTSGSCIDGDVASDFQLVASDPQNFISPRTFCAGVSTVTSTPTATETLTPTITGTPTITSTPTVTSTITQTSTVTMTPLLSPTATQTATSTVTQTPTATPRRDVLINEVAWAGTKDLDNPGQGSNAEWIELYNPGPLPITIEGWTLKFSGYTITFPTGSSISAGGYYLLERGSDTDISNIAADYVYLSSIALSDSGTSMFLWNGSVLIDTANGNGGSWPAGNTTNKCSMERASASSPDTDATWVTPPTTTQVGTDASGAWVCGTPKNLNWAYTVTLTPSPTLTPSLTPSLTRSLTPTKSLTPSYTPIPRKSATPTRTLTPTPNRATPEPIILNEFLPQPKSDYNGDGKVDSGDEFIELKNLSTNSISISGYRLDDQDGDSLPYTIKDVTMQPGQRLAFFASETGILLSTGGDSVRLYKPSGSLPADAFTYGVVKIPNQSWCRLPDNKQYFALRWTSGCESTPNEVNKLAESVFSGNRVEAAICLSKNLPSPVYQAECEPLGLEMWSQALWDELPPDFPRFFEFETQEFIVE